MSWDSYRKLDDDKVVNEEQHDFAWEEKFIPLLHSGFQESTSGRKPKSRLTVILLFTRGQYVIKLTDRVSHKVAWIESPPMVNLLEELERKIVTGEINWEIEEWDKPNGPSFS